MPLAYILTAVESSVAQWNAPSYNDIATALLGTTLPGGVRWVGPGPRVTRKTDPLTLHANITQFSWPITVDAPTLATADSIAHQTASVVQAALRGSLFSRVVDSTISSGWSTVTVAPFSLDVNGTLEWWQSGQAVQTQTRDAFFQGLARLQPDENPLGPDTPLVRPPTQGEALQNVTDSAVSSTVSTLWPIALLAGTAWIGIMVLPQVMAAHSFSKAFRRSSRKNPRKLLPRL